MNFIEAQLQVMLVMPLDKMSRGYFDPAIKGIQAMITNDMPSLLSGFVMVIFHTSFISKFLDELETK